MFITIIISIVLMCFALDYEDKYFKKWLCISDAIYYYQYDCISSNKEIKVHFYDRYTYKKALRNIFKEEKHRFLPEEKYELIKNYL